MLLETNDDRLHGLEDLILQQQLQLKKSTDSLEEKIKNGVSKTEYFLGYYNGKLPLEKPAVQPKARFKHFLVKLK